MTTNGPEKRHITLSASGRYYALAAEVSRFLEQRGVAVYTPDFDFFGRDELVSKEQKRKLTLDFLKKVECSDALLVVTDDKGYVGNSVSLEVGFAHALGKKVYRVASLSEPAIDCLTEYINDLDVLVSRFNATCGRGLSELA